MKDDNFSDIPEWDDELDDLGEEGEEWKPDPTKEACKALYKKWASIVTMLNGCLKTETEDKEARENWTEDYQAMMVGDAYEVAAKAIQSSMLLFMSEGAIEKQYGQVIRNEIEVFKQLFREWVGTFEKDEFTDEWGLFI